MKVSIPVSEVSVHLVKSAIKNSIRSTGWHEVLHTDTEYPSAVKEVDGHIYVASFYLPERESGVARLYIEVLRAGALCQENHTKELLNHLIRDLHRLLRGEEESPEQYFRGNENIAFAGA